MATPIHPKTANRAPVTQATPDSTAIIQVIERAALNPEVDIDKMERLLQMQERVLDRQALMAYSAAMQTELPSIVERGQGDSGQSHHCRRLLLAVYNGPEWPLELTRLRVIDRDLQDAALVVIEWATYSGRELHEYLNDGDRLMQRFWLLETHKEED